VVVVALVVTVTAALMNASIDHCHLRTTSRQTYFNNPCSGLAVDFLVASAQLLLVMLEFMK
ncbi:hypothetical protein HispidOSU_002103, partial [Sigmodon hispidus]